MNTYGTAEMGRRVAVAELRMAAGPVLEEAMKAGAGSLALER